MMWFIFYWKNNNFIITYGDRLSAFTVWIEPVWNRRKRDRKWDKCSFCQTMFIFLCETETLTWISQPWTLRKTRPKELKIVHSPCLKEKVWRRKRDDETFRLKSHKHTQHTDGDGWLNSIFMKWNGFLIYLTNKSFFSANWRFFVKWMQTQGTRSILWNASSKIDSLWSYLFIYLFIHVSF